MFFVGFLIEKVHSCLLSRPGCNTSICEICEKFPLEKIYQKKIKIGMGKKKRRRLSLAIKFYVMHLLFLCVRLR